PPFVGRIGTRCSAKPLRLSRGTAARPREPVGGTETRHPLRSRGDSQGGNRSGPVGLPSVSGRLRQRARRSRTGGTRLCFPLHLEGRFDEPPPHWARRFRDRSPVAPFQFWRP